ncbi:MAG: hypothetical protein WCS33_00455 [Candidatus Caldatribacteriota bacterium]
MGEVGRFSELGILLRKITSYLTDVKNPDEKFSNAAKDLCKLLYYTETNPLQQPMGQPLNPERPRPEFNDLKDVRDHIINQRILLVPRIPAPEERGGFVVVMIGNFSLSENKQFKVNRLIFDVLAHHDNWLLDDNLRPFVLMQQIDTIFNNRKLSIGRVEFKTADAIVLAPHILGYQLVYSDVTFN